MPVVSEKKILNLEFYDFRHVVLPKEVVKLVPKNHLMTEPEWRSIGIQQSQGWIHYMIHLPGIKSNTVYNSYKI